MVRALEHIRRMRGGAQSHLMRCSDKHYYIVKFQNNPQNQRVLANELLGTRLAARLGLPTALVNGVEVSDELVRLTPELYIESPRGRIPCGPGLQFGSQYPGDPRNLTLQDFLPDEKLLGVDNLHDFAGMLVFDKWTCNTDGRQTVFVEHSDFYGTSLRQPHADDPRPSAGEPIAPARYAVMVDQGFCFNAGEWNFPDAPLRGLYARSSVYAWVTGMHSFAPWLERLQQKITEQMIDELAKEIPPEWYDHDHDALSRLLEQLYRRRKRVPELLVSARDSNRQPFPHWQGNACCSWSLSTRMRKRGHERVWR